MNRKLFAFDIDGTLLDTQKNALDSTKEAIHKLRQEGHFVTLASGRTRFLVTEVLEELDIENYIVCNGAAAFLGHQQIFKNALDKTALKRMIAYMDDKKIDTAMMTLDGLHRCSSNELNVVEEAMGTFGQKVPPFDPQILEEEDIYQSLAFYTSEMDKEVNTAFPEFRFVRWHEHSVDVVPKNGSKAETLMFVADFLGIDRHDVISFGDGNNDIEMLQASGTGVAMGNASDRVKQYADMVTDSNDEDGIWNALRGMALV